MYRDTPRLIAQAQTALELDQRFALAETAYHGQQWSSAIQEYEALRQLDRAYAVDVVAQHLAEAYLHVGQQIVAQRPAAGADLRLAQTYFQKALALRPDPSTRTESDLLAAYLAGAQALQQANATQAIAALELVYQARPAYLGGLLAEQLYAAYLLAGDQAAQSGDNQAALGYYEKAAALSVADTNEALQRAQALSLAMVTPTPTPVPQAPVYAPPPPPPPPTATPAPVGLVAFQGWIAFRSNRDGDTAIYLMQPDGSQQQRAPNDAAEQFEQFYSQQQWTSDGIKLLYVASPSGRTDTNIFTVQSDLPEGAARDVMLTDFNLMEYDPVWSPAGTMVAFVSNHTGNDEIWTVTVQDRSASQRTHNEWEWDKHPTWSPDGAQIAFYSNRTGTRQIWVMNADGSNQHNLSNNQVEDWDPVWIR